MHFRSKPSIGETISLLALREVVIETTRSIDSTVYRRILEKCLRDRINVNE